MASNRNFDSIMSDGQEEYSLQDKKRSLEYAGPTHADSISGLAHDKSAMTYSRH